ncbi:MAG: hypothetical protein NT154_24685 [Verrucomicrobia bacterium]|nr:hypothetical protein [Verrucomicrobiota bacterium]
MKANANEKQVKAAREAVKEVETLAARITARTEAPKLRWQKLHREHEALVAEKIAEKFDPEAPLDPARLRAHAERTVKIEAYQKLFQSEPRNFPVQYASDGAALFAAICKLQKLTWDIGEPFEFSMAALRKHGFFGLGTTEAYTPAIGAARVIAWSRNFTHDAANRILPLAKEILSRRVPELPPTFGMTSRPLTWAEQQMIDSKSTPVAAAA